MNISKAKHLRYCDARELVNGDDEKSLIMDAGTHRTGLAILNLREKTATIIEYLSGCENNYVLSPLEEKLLKGLRDVHKIAPPTVPQVLRHDPTVYVKKSAGKNKKSGKKAVGAGKKAGKKAVGSGMSKETCKSIVDKIASDNSIKFFLIGLSAKQRIGPLKEEDFEAVVNLMTDLNDAKLCLRTFSVIDETHSSNNAEMYLKDNHPIWYYFEHFKTEFKELDDVYHDDLVDYKKDFKKFRKGMIDCFSAVKFAEQFMVKIANERDVTDVENCKRIENFFRDIGYEKIDGMI